MADPFVAEIRIFAFNFAPKGWAFCNGQLLPISQNTALFALLGTMYGGDGKSTFALPNLQGRAAMHTGQGQGLSQRNRGETGGTETVTLIASEIPAHTHTLRASPEIGEDRPAVGNALAVSTGSAMYQTNTGSNLVPMAFEALPPTGGGLPHNNMQPYLTMNFCIALQGIFPQLP